MPTVEEQIAEFEEEIRKTKYNKATQHHIGLVKAKIARLRDKQITASSKGGKSYGYSIKKTGDATVALVGYPSVGKSTLLNALTNADSKIAAYEFTTLTVVPGMLDYGGARIQLLDVPGLIEGAAEGAGRGKEVLSVIRIADLIVILADATRPEQLGKIKKELLDAGVRINRERPKVKIVPAQRGGIQVVFAAEQSDVLEETVKSILKEFRIMNALITIKEDLDVDRLIDAIEDNRVYAPSITVFNKIDLISKDALQKLKKAYPEAVFISANSGQSFDHLRDMIGSTLSIIRIYMKEVGKKPDMEEPLIVPKGATVEDVCRKIHRDFVGRFRFARIWGSSKFPGQKQSLAYQVEDGDIVQLHLR